jgi:ubiquinone/menaquinone biosynthesis C-methylase UbiE
VIGLDASESMLRQAAAETADKRVSYVLGDAAALPFPDDSFDAVSCMAALYLMDEPYHVIAELVRVLRPGGRIALLASCERGPQSLQPVLTAPSRMSGIRVFNRDELRDRLILLGLTDVRQEVHGMFQLVSAHLPAPTP